MPWERSQSLQGTGDKVLVSSCPSRQLAFSYAHLTFDVGFVDGMNSAILLVDDNAIQAATRKAILERAGRGVIVAPNGRAAIEILTGRRDQLGIRLVVTDHLMPGMNGPELVQELRTLGFDLPIVVLSGLPDAESQYQDLNIIFRLKPFPPEALIQLTNDLLCRRMPRTA